MALSNMFSSRILTETAASMSIYNHTTVESDNHRYFSEALEFAREINNDFLIANKVFYRSVLESQGNDYVIHESFSGFLDTVKSIIKKIIAWLEKLYDKFITAIMRFFKSDSYLKKHKSELSKFTSEDEFTYDGFEFTINPAVPTTEALEEFANSIANSDISGENLDKAAMKERYANLLNDLEGTFYDRARAQVLNTTGTIDESSYADELFKAFRNGDNSRTELTITSSEISSALTRFEKHADLLKTTKNNKTKLINKYKELEKSFSNAIIKIDNGKFKVKYGNAEFEVDKERIDTVDLWCKAKATQMQKLSNIHNMAFSAKLDAIKDCFNQDKSILYKALYKVQGRK